MPFAAALSQHPLATHAVGEVVGQVIDEIGRDIDLAILFVTGPFAGATEDIADAVRRLLAPGALIGTTSSSVLAGDREFENTSAICLFAATWSGRLRTGRDGMRAVRFATDRVDGGWQLTGSADVAVDGATLMLLADPATFPVEGFLDGLAQMAPGLTVVGGMASAADGARSNRFVIDDQVHQTGAVGLYFPPGSPVETVVSQACRPVGQPWVVTDAEAHLVREIAGRPALDLLMETAESVSPEDRAAMAAGLHVGVVVDERTETFTAGDYLIRPVLGADKSNGAIAVGANIEVGTTISFHVRDAASADEDLRGAVADIDAEGALVFTGTGRGRALFGVADHDAQTIDAHVTGGATAGMFCAGEIGPIGPRSHLHSFSTAALFFTD